MSRRLALVFGLLVGLLISAACNSAQPARVTQYTGNPCWSPNGKYHTPCEGAFFPGDYTKVFDEEKNREGTVMTEFKWIEFVGWTQDSRYAIFNGHDQYGNYDAHAFDTSDWRANLIMDVKSSASTGCGSPGDCTYGVVAFAPSSSNVLLQNGFLVQLPNSVHSKLLDTLGKNLIVKAAWSKDEEYLAFAGCRHLIDCALYIVGEDGMPDQQLVSLDGVPVKMEWEPSPSMVNVETENTHYSINVTTNQVQIVPMR